MKRALCGNSFAFLSLLIKRNETFLKWLTLHIHMNESVFYYLSTCKCITNVKCVLSIIWQHRWTSTWTLQKRNNEDIRFHYLPHVPFFSSPRGIFPVTLMWPSHFIVMFIGLCIHWLKPMHIIHTHTYYTQQTSTFKKKCLSMKKRYALPYRLTSRRQTSCPSARSRL